MPKARFHRFVTLAIAAAGVLLSASWASAQFTAEEVVEWSRWEAFLVQAKVIEQVQMSSREAVTSPWKLTLESEGVTRHALWKNPLGVQGGFMESWKYEIAAYRLDRLLGLNMVPPTVEREFGGYAGSCQLWIEDTALLRKKIQEGTNKEALRSMAWRRVGFIAQAFDNLIGNEDRHSGNVLVTADFRGILIDHSRTFRTSEAFTKTLLFSEAKAPGVAIMRELPRQLVEKIRALDEASLRKAVGPYLTDAEIQAVLTRHGLLVAEIDRLIQTYGEASVLY